MSQAVHLLRGFKHNLTRGACIVSLMAVGGAAFAAVGQAVSRPGPIPDQATFHAATRQQHQLSASGEEEGIHRCELSQISENLALIYQQDDLPGALKVAKRCELLAVTQGRPEYQTMASRIRAMVAIKSKDMTSLEAAGKALVAQSLSPEYLADGHLFIAFACTFSGRVVCARTHLDQAKALFVRHEVTGALEQLMSVEQALVKLEASSTH